MSQTLDQYLDDVRTVVEHAADPSNDDTLDDLIALRGALPSEGGYDDPEVEGLHDLGELTSEELDYLEAVEAERTS